MKKNKKWTKLTMLTIIILIFCIIIAIHFFNKNITKEILKAKSFIELLSDNNMIDKDNSKKIKFHSVKQVEGGKETYKVTSKDYGIDINSKHKVIGFTYNISNISEITENNVSEKKARKLAEKYVSKLVKDDYKYKDKIDDGDVSYYGYIFTRYKDGYPFYSDQITIQIDKRTGYLVGFSNTASQGSAKKAVINLETAGARQIGLDTFYSKYKNKGLVNDDEVYLAFCDNEDKSVTELCYVVTVSGKDSDDKDIKFKYFISSDTGEVINTIKDIVSKTIA